ncbi:MAG: OmpA family protein [Balneolaceae bacterium]
MIRQAKIIITVCIITVSGFGNIAAQSLSSALFDNSGLQMGMFRGQTEFDDSGLNYSFRLYSQQIFDDYRFGELSISSGALSGLGYRSQLTPLEYRFGYHLSRFGAPELNIFGSRSSFYAYAGLGILYHRPLEIFAPDDPLTVEMGKGLATSSFWDFNGGIAPFIPIGTGIEIPLEQNIWLNFSIGYNQSISALKFNSHDVPGGYWHVSVGMRFKRSAKKRKPIFIPPVRQFKKQEIPPVARHQVEVEPADLSNGLIGSLNSRAINFEILSSTPDEEGKEWIEEVARILKLHPKQSLQVFGHADSIGTKSVNRMISESRARAIWLALIDEGVNASRLGFNWYADDRPLSSNGTSVGRLQNRRVEFKTASTGMQFVKKYREDEIYRASIFANFEYDTPLLEPRDIDFNLSMLGLDNYSVMLIQLVSYLMYDEEEMELVIINRAGSRGGADLRTSLSKARAELMRAELILKGIDPQRVKAAVPGSELYKQYEHHLQGQSQQNILIPVLTAPNEKDGEGK